MYDTNETPFPPVSQPKKGSLWVPAIFLIVMLAIGTAVFFAFPEAQALAGAPWFRSDEGMISFDPYLYYGSPELEVPEGVTGLADRCFADCDDLTTVKLPDSLVTVGEEAFADCDSLRGVKLPEGVTDIGDGAFRNCTALEALVIPATAERIGTDIFEGCDALRHIFFEGTKTQWVALNLGKIGPQTTIYCIDGDLTPAGTGN